MSVNIKAVLKGAGVSLIITILAIFILSVLAYFTDINDTAVTVSAYVAVIIGIMTGSFIMARVAPTKKLLYVILVCAVFTLVLLILSMLLNGRVLLKAHTAGLIGGIFAASLLGAVIGNR